MPKTSTTKDLFKFLREPNFNRLQDVSIRTKIIVLFKVLILTYIGLIIASVPFQILNGLNIIGETANKLDSMLHIMNERNLAYRPYFIFSSVLLVPLLEETAFRLFLTKFKTSYFVISVSLIVSSLLTYFLGASLWRPESYLLFALSSYFYVLIFSGIIGVIVLWFLRKHLTRISKFWNTRTRLIFYAIAVLFAMFHFMSIDFNKTNLAFAPVILLPFLVYGLSFGYIRIKLGFTYSVVLHFIILAFKFGLPELINALKS